MSDRESYRRKLFAEASRRTAAPSTGPHTKLSISLPTELLDLVKASAAASGQTVSATIAASLRRTMEDAEQANLDRALELDAEWNEAWAKGMSPMTAKLWAELEW